MAQDDGVPVFHADGPDEIVGAAGRRVFHRDAAHRTAVRPRRAQRHGLRPAAGRRLHAHAVHPAEEDRAPVLPAVRVVSVEQARGRALLLLGQNAGDLVPRFAGLPAQGEHVAAAAVRILGRCGLGCDGHGRIVQPGGKRRDAPDQQRQPHHGADGVQLAPGAAAGGLFILRRLLAAAIGAEARLVRQLRPAVYTCFQASALPKK